MLNKTMIKVSSLALALSFSPTILADSLAGGNELISNGSFENFTVSKDNGNWKLVQFDGWQGDGEVWTSGLGKAATDGSYKIELDVGNEINTLSQTVTTVADQKYRFSLDAYARRANSSDFEILLDGNVITTIKPDRKWAEHEAYFVATGGEQIISIKELDAQSNGLGTIIDNVRLTESNELILNGSFEDFTVSKDNGNWKLVNFTGWEGVGEAWTNGLGKRSTLGAYKIELDVGSELNSLSQTIAIEDGAEYELSLDAYARTKNSSDFELWLDDEKLLSITPATAWDRYRVKFFGNGTSQRIIIKELDTQNNGLGSVIDNVSLVSTGEMLNAAPVISGTSTTKMNTGDSYSFTPTASDENSDDTLTFSINNQPDWASFDTATGQLSGTPTSESTSNNIVISVSDGKKTASLAAFNIEVKDAVNIARQFGIATQAPRNGYYYYSPPSNVIDGDVKTYNHTQCSAGENWWQLALPQPSNITKIMLQGRSSNTSRLNDAEVYITATPYNGTLNASDKVASLVGNANQQETAFATPKSGNYLIVKAADANCLHLAEVEVYGSMPETPSFATHDTNYLIQGSTAVGSTIASLNALDYQGDDLTYKIRGDMPFAVDAQGNVSISKALEGGTYTVVVEVSDGTQSSQTTLTINVTSNTAVSDAISSGSVAQVTEQELITATLEEIEATKNLLLSAKAKIFNLNADGSAKDDGSSLTLIDWNPSHDASTFVSTLGKNTALLSTNAVAKSGRTIYNKEIAIIGEKANARYMVMGANPLRVTGNEQMNQVMENAIAWLSGRDDLKQAPFNVVMAQMDESYWFKDESKTRAWLESHYAGQVNYNSADSCDATALSGCLNSDTDLLIISQISQDSDDIEAIATTVNQALEDGISVLYIHHDGNQKALGNTLFSEVFDVRYEWDNYWKNLSIAAYNPTESINVLPASLAKIKTLFSHFKDADYAFNWSQCVKENCNAVTGLNIEFKQGATVVKGMMNSLDAKKKNIFNEDGYRLQKLLALSADKFRQGVSFPMDKVSTDGTRFLKSYYADHAVYNYRDINPAQADMGNFSRSNFSHITPTSRTVNLTTKNGFHSTGAYALPGQTVSVTRHDNSDVAVTVFVNTQRAGSTHEWANNGYKRPKYLKSQRMEVKAGETITFTSPYGGPIQLGFNAKDLPVSVSLKNIGEHPYWASPADNASFTQKMDAGHYDWAEISTTGFEVHSTLDKMRKSIANPQWGSAQALATGTMRYMYNLPHALAGFQGPNIDPIPELHDFANANGWTINTLDKVQHMNADQATCGSGCSGNPYDAYWAFNPTGHGDVHELGHGLQGGKRFAGWENHSMTNYYSYFTKSQYYQDTGSISACQSLPFESNFKVLQDSVNQADSAAYVKTNLWDKNSWSKSAGMFIQMMMAAQNEGVLQNGWLLRGRLHMFERELNRAKKTEALWNEKRDSLGFGEYAWSDIKSINNNDWYLVATTYVTGRDFSDYFDMWAIPYSIKAKAQVTALGYEMMPKQYYKSGAKDYCLTLDKTAIEVDGQQTW